MHIVPWEVKFPVNNSWCWCNVMTLNNFTQFQSAWPIILLFRRDLSRSHPRCIRYEIVRIVESLNIPPWRRSCLAPACNVHSPVTGKVNSEGAFEKNHLSLDYFEERNFLTHIHQRDPLKQSHVHSFCCQLLGELCHELPWFSRQFCTASGLTSALILGNS